jgi:hypothetical protein
MNWQVKWMTNERVCPAQETLRMPDRRPGSNAKLA